MRLLLPLLFVTAAPAFAQTALPPAPYANVQLPNAAQEAKATTIIAMPIEDAAAKVRAKGVGDDEKDFDLPIWAGVIPVTTVLGPVETCHRLVAGVDKPETLSLFPEGGRLDTALLEGQRIYEEA